MLKDEKNITNGEKRSNNVVNNKMPQKTKSFDKYLADLSNTNKN